MDSVLHESGLADALPEATSIGAAFDQVFELLDEWYRCEYVFKNQLAQHTLSSLHSADAQFFFELRVAGRIADAAAFNGTSTVYEIKTGLDNFDRLDDQLQAYTQTFDRVYVATEASLATSLSGRVPDGVGLVVVAPGGDVEEVCPSASHLDRFDPGPAFDVFRKREYLAVTEEIFGGVPDVPTWELYDACRELFCGLDARKAHHVYFQVMRSRERAGVSDISSLPSSLFAVGVGGKLSSADRAVLPQMLANKAVPV